MKKVRKLIITFNTTTRAMAAGQALDKANVPGKLGSVPGSIRAGCGLAWMGPPDTREQAERVLKEGGIQYHEMHEQEV